MQPMKCKAERTTPQLLPVSGFDFIRFAMGVFTSAALFDHFFPREAATYHRIVRDHCSAQYAAYKNEPISRQSCQGVLECILDHTSETHKAQLGTTSLILGLTPTILSWTGNGVFEMSLLSSQRPVLSVLLSVGAPVFSPTSLFPQWRPAEILAGRPLAFKTPQAVKRHPFVLAVAQYVFAVGAIANLTHVAYIMSYMSVTLSSGCQNRYFVFLWIYVAVSAHICGWFAVHTRASWARSERHMSVDDGKRPERSFLATLRRLAAIEISPCFAREPHVLKWKVETGLGLFLVNLTTVVVLGHVVWGTIILGSTTLVEPVDAVMLIGRFVASTVVCKAILMFELAGMREVTTLEEEAVVVRTSSQGESSTALGKSATVASGSEISPMLQRATRTV
ncbi:hypothetical protein BDV95DRAFT_670625 [Massariosphaeria phaeospora]|uniref:Uncharacterized protein n=1 Tax=Massariosphaeria phaeospora TaxID=100035 RepID=A0A7C8M2I5_9PLEO|nr:hypothetical protein BDV95DRAFT_670625 [Massariosphaeria phaeospora]